MPKTRDDTRRGNGLGSVYRRGDKWRWEVTLGYHTVADPTTGALRRARNSIGSTALTETLAQLALARAITDHQRGLIAPSTEVTLEQYAEVWLGRQTSLEPSSIEKYRWELGFPLKRLGSKRVKDLKPADLKDYVASLPRAIVSAGGSKNAAMRTKRPMSPRTQGKIVTRLRSLFAEAVSDQIIYTNPMDAVRRARGSNTVERIGKVYDFPDLARANQVGKTLHEMSLLRGWIAVQLALGLGMRRGEILGLMWADINMVTGTLKVQRGLKNLTVNGPVFGPPKTKASRREIGIPASLRTALKAQLEQQGRDKAAAGSAWRNTGAVVSSELGNFIHPSNFKRTLETMRFWSDPKNLEPRPMKAHPERMTGALLGIPERHRAQLEAITRAGSPLPAIRVHDLRHTYATLALRSKVPDAVVSRTLGHTRISITQDTYRHVLESEMRGNDFDLLAGA